MRYWRRYDGRQSSFMVGFGVCRRLRHVSLRLATNRNIVLFVFNDLFIISDAGGKVTQRCTIQISTTETKPKPNNPTYTTDPTNPTKLYHLMMHGVGW